MAVKDNPQQPAQQPAEVKAASRQPAVDPQEVIDRETEQGFRGVEVDPTPNENYTLQGVTSGKPTPETDPEHAEQVRREVLGIEQRANGVGER